MRRIDDFMKRVEGNSLAQVNNDLQIRAFEAAQGVHPSMDVLDYIKDGNTVDLIAATAEMIFLKDSLAALEGVGAADRRQKSLGLKAFLSTQNLPYIAQIFPEDQFDQFLGNTFSKLESMLLPSEILELASEFNPGDKTFERAYTWIEVMNVEKLTNLKNQLKTVLDELSNLESLDPQSVIEKLTDPQSKLYQVCLEALGNSDQVGEFFGYRYNQMMEIIKSDSSS